MTSTVPVLRLRDVLIVPIQGDLGDAVADELQQTVLERLAAEDARGLILEISALEIVDSYVARLLTTTARMAALMGTRSVLAGMRPEVAATLVQMGYQVEAVECALDLDAAFDLLNSASERLAFGSGVRPG